MRWQILETGLARGSQIMSYDQELLKSLDKEGAPIIHFYEWDCDTATYGYFEKPFDHLNGDSVSKLNLHLARRPTGGGVIFHLCDFAFSLLIPARHRQFSVNTLENYAFVNTIAAKAVEKFLGRNHVLELLQQAVSENCLCTHFCMAQPTIYDIMLHGKKVGGGAQRRTRNGFLHQGTISLAMPAESFLRSVLKADVIFPAMQRYGGVLLDASWTAKHLAEARKELKELLKTCFVDI